MTIKLESFTVSRVAGTQKCHLCVESTSLALTGARPITKYVFVTYLQSLNGTEQGMAQQSLLKPFFVSQ